MLPRRIILLLLAFLVILTGTSASAFQQDSDRRLFEQTNQVVSGAFLRYWDAAPNPVLLFGYPISPELPHPIRQNVQIQFFQRARMEYDPTLPAGQQVTLAPLGAWNYKTPGIPADFPLNNCITFDQSTYSVCYAFRQFYEANEGETYFGLPISQAQWEDNRLVQYFERARMEWRPEMPAGQRVTLTELGRLDFNRTIGVPIPADNILNMFSEMRVYAFVEQPLMRADDLQHVFVLVRKKDQSSIAGASVRLTVVYRDRENPTVERRSSSMALPLTNEDGVTELTFPVENVQPNDQIRVEVEVINSPTGPLKNPEDGQTSTWFRIWW